MKKIQTLWCFLLSTLLIVSSISPILAVERDENWNNTIYHLCDDDNVLTDEEFKDENEEVSNFIDFYDFELATFIIPTSNYSEYGFDTYLSTIYSQNDMGFGVNKDGIILGMDKDKETFLIQTFGRGNELFGEEEFQQLAEAIHEGYFSNEFLGAQVAYRETVADIIFPGDDGPSTEKKDYGNGFKMEIASLLDPDIKVSKKKEDNVSVPEESAPEAEDIPLPDWYITDPSNFTCFNNDPSTSRVIDVADIFTDEEENKIKARIKELAKTKEDIVVYTDITSYGIDAETFAEAVYQYNGYGYGENNDGLVLFINMDPNHREMVTSTFGNALSIFTASKLEALDDILSNQFKDQKYEAGVLEWLDGIDEILEYGVIGTPEWFKEYKKGTFKPSKSMIIDNENLIDDDKKASIEKQLETLKEKYNVPFMIYVSDDVVDLSGDEDIAQDNSKRISYHMDQLFEAYKVEENCIVLTYFQYEFPQDAINIYTLGNTDTLINEKEKNRIIDLLHVTADDYKFDETIENYFKYADLACAGKRLPHRNSVRIFWFILCLLSGLLVGGTMLFGAQRKMKTVARAKSASNEVVSNSFKTHSSMDIPLGIRTSSTYSPRSKGGSSSSRGSSSSGSRSTYHGSHTTSTGRSSSSSRRSF